MSIVSQGTGDILCADVDNFVPDVDKKRLRIYITAVFLPEVSSHTNPTVPVAILNISQDFTASFLQAEGKKRRGYLFPYVGGI